MPHTPEQKRLHRLKPEVRAYELAYRKTYYAANRDTILAKQKTPEGHASGRIKSRRHYRKHHPNILQRMRLDREARHALTVIEDTHERKAKLATREAQLSMQLDGGPITWAYLAGLFDGEGCISTTRTGSSKHVVGRVTIANTFHELLHVLQQQFGGTLSIRSKGSKPGWKPFGSITWSNRQALYLLEKIQPYLIVKRHQADLVVELIRMRDAPKSERYTTGRPRRLRPVIAQRETAIALALKALNRRGVISSLPERPSALLTEPPPLPDADCG